MKRTLIVAAFIGLAMASCKKDYTCVCTVNTTGGTSFTSQTTTIHDTKSNAKKTCENMNANSTGVVQTCQIQ